MSTTNRDWTGDPPQPYPACPRAREHHLMERCGGCGYPDQSGRTLSPIEVLHLAAHTGRVCPIPPPTVCAYYDDAEQAIVDLADAGHRIVPRAGITFWRGFIVGATAGVLIMLVTFALASS